jgi:hypothetical protein
MPDVNIEPGAMGHTVTLVGGSPVHWLVGVGDGADVVDLTGVDLGRRTSTAATASTSRARPATTPSATRGAPPRSW